VDWLASDTLDGTTLVNGFTDDIHDASQSLTANGDFDGGSGVNNFLTSNKTLGTIHGNCTDSVLAQMGGDLKH
jgi:hypothetical protein